MSLGDNTLSPLEIADARDAAYRASELQRECEDQIRAAARDLANKERGYRQALATKILELRAAEDAAAWSACADLARGDRKVATCKFERDVADGVLDAARQQAFRRGADRRDVHELLRWSQARDLRTDTPPPSFDRPPLEPVA